MSIKKAKLISAGHINMYILWRLWSLWRNLGGNRLLKGTVYLRCVSKFLPATNATFSGTAPHLLPPVQS